jgi:anti-sigma-K factor RskA
MPNQDPETTALAAGLVMGTLSDAEVSLAEALVREDPEFATLVSQFRAEIAAEGDSALPDRVWQGIEGRLTGRQN